MANNSCSCGCKDNKSVCDCEVINHEAVASVQKSRTDQLTLFDMADFFTAFSDSTRLKIIDLLQKAELCVCDLSVLLGMTKSAVSHQLKFLRDLNVVKFRKVGKIVYYSLADDHVEEIFDVCKQHVLEEVHE